MKKLLLSLRHCPVTNVTVRKTLVGGIVKRLIVRIVDMVIVIRTESVFVIRVGKEKLVINELV